MQDNLPSGSVRPMNGAAEHNLSSMNATTIRGFENNRYPPLPTTAHWMHRQQSPPSLPSAGTTLPQLGASFASAAPAAPSQRPPAPQFSTAAEEAYQHDPDRPKYTRFAEGYFNNLSADGHMSISSDFSLTPKPGNHGHANPSRKFHPGLSEMTSEPLEPEHMHFVFTRNPGRQHMVFQTLVKVCADAAYKYHRTETQRRLSEVALLDSPEGLHGSGHYKDSVQPDRKRCRTTGHARVNSDAGCPPPLMDLLSQISDSIWTKAKSLNSHTARLEAVRRMASLYSWADTVIGALSTTEQSEIVPQAKAYNAIMAARDFASFFLFEEGKERIDSLWKSYWVLVEAIR